MGSESVEKSAIRVKKRYYKGVLLLLLVGALAMILMGSQKTKTSLTKITKSSPEEVNLTKFEGCTVSFQPPPPKANGEWTTKPLWLPSYPSTLEDNTHRQIVNELTGLKAGGKSFYASNKREKLRQCFSQTETATCANIHPIVEMNGGPETKANQFSQKFILAIRNPRTVLPAFLNAKAIKYHGQKGQVPEEDWRNQRDTFIEEMMEGWKLSLRTWKAMNVYQPAMYLVHEHLMDARKGPDTLRRFGGILREAGFVAAQDEDIPCIWYKAIGKEQLEQYQKSKYEYKDYIPGFTKAQQEHFMGELSALMTEFSDDAELVSILKEYHDDVRDNIHIDREWVNQTANARG
eukprot:CAMPEP_0195535192 /NCGR_PEP_ID=MMETSP0794_2-20130614/43801_1 /TAXON_ID=515487 /ORGANISM="Stephanopyxis turris, Strain CCMP 815" /LENGTH=347 /DNA_ID=CAMNT_0040668263 /DNA_START=71 /DNA_END=1114 /DNA_ORIENTATION=+